MGSTGGWSTLKRVCQFPCSLGGYLFSLLLAVMHLIPYPFTLPRRLILIIFPPPPPPPPPSPSPPTLPVAYELSWPPSLIRDGSIKFKSQNSQTNIQDPRACGPPEISLYPPWLGWLYVDLVFIFSLSPSSSPRYLNISSTNTVMARYYSENFHVTRRNIRTL